MPNKPLRIAMWCNSSAAAYWRLADPAKYLRKMGIDARVMEEGVTREACEWADIIVTQMCVDKDMIALIREYQVLHGKKYVVEQDDLPDIDPSNPHRVEHEISDAPEVIKISMGIADMVTTTTPYLANKLSEYSKNVWVLPNAMDLERWDLPKLHNTSKTIRIGWLGSITHLKDLELVVNPLRRICAEYPNVQIVAVGDMRVRELLKGLPAEVMLGVPFEAYPARLNGLRLDIGLAPLQPTEFNKCKSNIKWMEYAIADVPGVYSPTVYNHESFEPNLGLVANNEEQWYRCIKNLITVPDLGKGIVDSAHRLVQRKYDLSREVQKWAKAYQSLTQDPKHSMQSV